MKRIITIVLTVLLIFSSSAFAFAILPPWCRTEEDKIVHAEGRDENDPYLAYDENGTVYTLDAIFVSYICNDFEEAKQIGAEIISYAKSLPGVADATSNSFLYHEGWENYYTVMVKLEYPFETYETVYAALKSYPGITRVLRATLETATPKDRLYYGDVDFNGTVTAADARQILRYGVSLDTPEDYHISFGDLNGDGVLTAADARTCLRMAVGLETPRIYDGD